jgi:hypothetical protein
MNMQMEYGLTAIRVRIYDDTISVFRKTFITGDIRRREQ